MYSSLSPLSRVTPPSRVTPLYGTTNIYTIALLTRFLIVTDPLFSTKHFLALPIGPACYLFCRKTFFLPLFCRLGVIAVSSGYTTRLHVSDGIQEEVKPRY